MQFYTLKDLSEMLHLSMTTIYRYVQFGKLKATKIGNSYRLTEEDLQNFMNHARATTNARRAERAVGSSIGAVLGASSSVVLGATAAAVLGATACLAARKAGSEVSSDVSAISPDECSTAGTHTASVENRSGILRQTINNGDLTMAEPSDFEEPPAEAVLAITGIVKDVFGKITEYTPLPRQQALITVKKIRLTDNNEIEEAHNKFCEALNGIGWKLDSMIVTNPKYRKFGLPLDVLIYLTYTGSNYQR